MLPGLLLQVVLIALNAFFAASEIAVLQLNENVIRKLAEDGDKKAAKMLRMVSEPTGFLSTIQVGITLAGFLGSAFAADSFADDIVRWLVGCGVTFIPEAVLDKLAVIFITIILSYFTLICGELVPKRVAMRNPEKLARAVCGFIITLSVIMKPVVWLLSASTNGVLRLLGINPNEEEDAVSEEDIRMMIDIGEEKGAIESEEKQMIDNIFEFNNTSVGDVMTHRTSMVVIYADDDKDEILHTILESGFSRFPVCGEDADDVLGVLRTREYLLNAQSENPRELKDLLKPAFFVPESLRADDLFRRMKREKKHLAVVVDEFGGTAGLITLEDLLEEIVGKIYDETDKNEEEDIRKTSETKWIANGNCTVERFCEVTGFSFDEDEEPEFSTVGGLVFTALGIVPEDGSTPETEIPGFCLRVLSVTDHRIGKVEIEKLPEPLEEDEEALASGL